MSFDATLTESSWSPPAILNEDMLLRHHEQHMLEHDQRMRFLDHLSQQESPTPSPRTPDTAPMSRSSSCSSFNAFLAPNPSIMSRSASFCTASTAPPAAPAVSLFSQRGGASCLMQQLSLSRTMAAGTQQDFVEQIAAGLRSDNPEDRENACSALVNTCCKDGLSHFVLDIALPPLALVILLPESARSPVLRHAAIVLLRLAENRDVAVQMQRVPAVSDAVLHLVGAPVACVWRNALRAALLMSYFSPASFAPLLLHANCFPLIVKILHADKELRFDAIRGVRGLATAPGGCQVLLQQPALLQCLFRLSLTTTLVIEFEHAAASLSLLLASAPEARACLVSAAAAVELPAGELRPLKQATADLVAMVQALLDDARVAAGQACAQQQHVVAGSMGD